MTLKGQNRAYHTEKKSESEVLAQTCSAELSLSLHNLLPDCFHFIGSAHRTHSSAIPPPLFPPHPPSFSPPFYVLFPSWTRLCLEDDCLLFILVTYFYSHTLLSTHPHPPPPPPFFWSPPLPLHFHLDFNHPLSTQNLTPPWRSAGCWEEI